MRFLTKYSFFLSCILVFVLCTDKSLASGPPQCKFKCRGQGGSLVKLEEGVTYIYNLQGNTETSVPKSKGPYGESVKLNIKARVEVSALPQCKTVIQLRDVQVTGPDGKPHQGLGKLEEHPLVVSLHGGKLDSEVCAVHDDNFASLNIKRAVASLLQANTGEHGGNGHETDVFGSCPTSFKVTKDGAAIVVHKQKDLDRCKFRENLRQSLFSRAHGHSNDIHSSPLLGSNYDVEQRIQNGILESATAKEEYLFRPFSNRENGAKTKVFTKMVLESKNPGPPPAFANNEPRSIFFENPHETVTCNRQTLLGALRKVTDSADGSVPATAAKDFANFVKLMRRASKEDLLAVYGDCKAGAGFQARDVAKKAYTDALFQAGSADSVAAAVELLRSNEITGDRVKYWYLSFAFVRHTSASALASAMTLLDNPQLPTEAYLGIGALAGHYCREHVCDGIPQVEQLLARFIEVVGAPAKIPRNKENQVIAALKGLANVKHLNEETANKVTQIMKDGHVSTRIRVAAMETARSDACRGKIQKGAGDIFYNREEDSEVRLKAFLVLVECPTPKLANKLSEFMETEPVNQVGAYVTSYLRNLRASSNPDKENLREILFNVKPRKKFPFDIRKFSRNHEFSYNFNTLSTSAAAESNVIFSQKSYIPRSVNLNLTVEVFGHAFNLFELSGRAENLERIYERYFGPKGYFSTHKPLEVYKDARQVYKELEARVEEKYKNIVHRGRRSVSRPDISRFAGKVKLFNSKLDNNIDVDLSMKVLGNELSWVNIEDIETPITPVGVVDKLAAFLENGMGNVRDFRHDLKNHYNFLDTELTYPTSSGLALRLSAVGSGVVYLKLGGNFDVSSFLRDPKNGHAKFEVIPSASVEVAGEFGVDGYAVEAGVKLSGNLHTSTGSEITLQMLNGHGFDLNVGLPLKKSDILTVNTEVFSFVREEGTPSVDTLLEFSVPRNEYHGCFDQLQDTIGLIICGDVRFPNDQKAIIPTAALYPLNGHSILSFRIDKDHESLTTYHMKMFYDLENPKNRRLEFKIDTPGTQRPREVSFLAALVTEPDKAVDIQFISPVYKFTARGAIVDNDNEYSISAYAKLDETQEYRARLGLISTGSSYRPILEYTPIGGVDADVHVDGEVLVEKHPGTPFRRFTFRGVRLSAKKMAVNVDGSIATDDNMFESDLHVAYDQHTTGIKTKFQMHGTNNFKMNVELSPSQYPDFNVGVKYEYLRSDHHLENSFVFVHGKDLASTKNKLSIFQQLDYRFENLQTFDFATKNTFSYPLLDIEVKVEGAATRKSLSYDIEGLYGKTHAKSKLNAKTSVKDLGDYDVDFMIAAFDKELSLQARREVVDPYKSRYTQRVEVKPGNSYEVAAEVTHHFGGNELKFSIIATSANYPNHALDAGLTNNDALFDGYFKVNDGSKNVVDGILKFSKVAPQHGNLKLFLERYLDATGEYQADDTKVVGNLLANFAELKRVFKGTVNLARAGHRYTGVIEGGAEVNGQPKWNARIDTDTEAGVRMVDSKNKIAFLDKHMEVDFNGKIEGRPFDGSTTCGFQLTLPSGRYYGGSFRREAHSQTRDVNEDVKMTIEYANQKGGPLSKYFLTSYLKNFDSKTTHGRALFEIGKEGPEGNVVIHYGHSRTAKPQSLEFEQDIAVTGSLVKTPFDSKAFGLYSKEEFRCEATCNFGEYHLRTKTKALSGIKDNVRHADVFIELDTPNESARKIKLEHMVHFVQGDNDKPWQFQFLKEFMLNEKLFKASADATVHGKHGNIKGELLLPGDAAPANFDLKYNRDGNDDAQKAEVTLNANYDNDKRIAANGVFDVKNNYEVLNAHITAQTTLQSLQNLDLKLNGKSLSPTSRADEFVLVLNGDKSDGYLKFDISPKQPLIDILVNNQGGKSRIYHKMTRKSDRQINTEGQVAWTTDGGGMVDFSSNLDVESYDNFHILAKVNSEKLNINKLKMELGNKATKSGAAKKINFTAQTADKKGFSGSVTYAVKETETGFTVEGKGNIEVQGEKSPLTYKAAYKTLSRAVDSEVGTIFNLNADFDKGNFLVDYKMTDKELLYVNKFCHKGQCSLFELLNKLQRVDFTEFTHDASLTYQNTLMERNDNFKAFTKTHKKGFIVNHETALVLKDTSYHTKYYVNEAEGGLVIILPYREIAAIANYELPLDLHSGKPKTDLHNFRIHFDGSVYLDRKNKPDQRGNLLIVSDYATGPKSVSSKAEIKISHPALQKPLAVKARAAVGTEQRLADVSVEIDIFNKKNQKMAATLVIDHLTVEEGHNVTASLEIINKGLNMDVGSSGHLFVNHQGVSVGSFVYYHDAKNVRKEAGAFVESNPKRVFALVKIPNRELLKIDSVIQGTEQQRIMDAEINVAELRYYIVRVECNGAHGMKAAIHRKDTPDKKLEVSTSVSPGLVELRVEGTEGPAKDNLLLITLTSHSNQEHRPTFEINSEKIKHAMHIIKTNARELSGQVNTVAMNTYKESLEEYTAMLKNVKKFEPDFKPLLQHIQAEFQAIRKEVAEDPNFNKFSAIVQKIFGGMIDAIEESIQRLINNYKKMSQEMVELQQKVAVFVKDTLTRFLETSEKTLEPFMALVHQLCDTGCALAGYAFDMIKENEEEIRQVLVAVSGYVQEFIQFCVNIGEKLRHETEDFYRIVADQIKTMPIYTNFQEKFKDLTNVEFPHTLKNFYSELTFAFEDMLKTPELRDFADNFFSYIVKLPLPSVLVKLPRLGSFKELSFVRYLKSFSELPSPTEYYYTYRPFYNLLDNIPPFKAYGMILNSHHFFTFDQRHFAFKGTCSYVLAQDFLDGNFSIVANVENGIVKSITMSDQEDTVEMFGDRTVSVNGQHGDYPVNHNQFNGWVRYGTFNMKHKSGVHITKYLKQDLYIFRISGFYFGRTRGLLGTISNEYFDDYTLPNGHIAKDTSEFANAYKVMDECPPGAEYPPSQGHAPECNQLFSAESELQSGYNLINPEIYKEACDQHVGNTPSDKLTKACDVASAYVLALKQDYLPFPVVPEECVTCNINGQPSNSRQRVDVHSPEGKADVVVVFEQSAFNAGIFRDLVTPLIGSLSHDLKGKGLGDVEFALIGYGGPNQEYPQHYGNNGKITYEGKSDNIKFTETEEPKQSFDTWEKRLNYVIKYIKTELGQEPIVQAMQEANIYPFRQGAAKIIILVASKSCPLSPTFPFSLQLPRVLSIRKYYSDNGLQFHIITPLSKTLSLSNKPGTELKNVVGFDSSKIYTFADAKKSDIEGDATDRPYLILDNDLCLSFSQYNGGAAFNSNVFAHAKPEQQKKFVHVASRRIAKGAVEHRYTESCTCKLYHGIFSYPECKVVEKV